MQYLIATTFEVVHYIALQAVHYKPLQEVHLSRYNHVKSSRTYEEDSKLYGYILDLKRFEKILNKNIAKGYVKIEERELNGINDLVFEI